MSYPSMPLSHLPLRPSTLSRCQQRGFMFTNELEDSKRRGGMNNLANELGVNIVEAASLLREVESAVTRVRGGANNHHPPVHGPVEGTTTATMPTPTTRTLRTAAELYSQYHHQSQKNRSIITVCRSLDRLLGDGFPRAEVTEVVGMPGVGKTQLAMQLSVTTGLLASYGGVEGQAIYLDTEGSFSPERCYAMAQALVHHVQATFQRRKQNLQQQEQSQPPQQQNSDHPTKNLPPQPLPEWWTAEHILQGIHVYRIHDDAALMATITALPQFMEEQEKQGKWPVRLVVIDSIAFPFRSSPTASDYLARTRSLTTVAAMLADLAQQHHLAVMVINHMTTQFVEGQSHIVPALGESWAHTVTNRLLLSSMSPLSSHHHVHHNDDDDDDDNDTTARTTIRKCTLVKSPHKPNGDAYFQVLECGIRDVPMMGESQEQNTNHQNESHHMPDPKRFRAQY